MYLYFTEWKKNIKVPQLFLRIYKNNNNNVLLWLNGTFLHSVGVHHLTAVVPDPQCVQQDLLEVTNFWKTRPLNGRVTDASKCFSTFL